MLRLKLSICISIILMALGSFAQSFEGIIKFKIYTPIDTIHYIYYEKGGIVKIEEYNLSNQIKNFIIIDLTNTKATTFYPERQVFYVAENYFSGNTSNYDIKIEKGKKMKEVAGIDCQEWHIKSKTQNIDATLYLSPSKYDFSKSLFPILQRRDKIFKYFMQFPELRGFLPMYASETGSAKSQRFAFEITSISEKVLLGSEFQFPTGFKKHE
jgi:hypothetical protein